MSVPLEYLLFKITIYKRVIFIVATISIVALLLRHGDFALGAVVGGLIAVAIFSLLYKYVLALRNIQIGQKGRFIIPRALMLYAIIGFTLFIAITKGLPVFLGAAAGIFSLKIAIFLELFRGERCQAAN
ncbi:MAG: hypothetical protein HQ572_00390 [Candidatus Omnitrophica bacterium]|nr:hypothetical protein [Candidatus Omnitrophota bacterium]